MAVAPWRNISRQSSSDEEAERDTSGTRWREREGAREGKERRAGEKTEEKCASERSRYETPGNNYYRAITRHRHAN